MTTPDVNSFENRLFSREVRMAMQVGHTLRMLSWSCLNVGSSDGQVRNVSVDLFLIHSRLMCELLLVKPSRWTTDFSVLDICKDAEETEEMSRTQWSGPTDEQKSPLLPLWETASKHVVHFSKDRTPDNLQMIEPEDLTTVNLRRLTLIIFSILNDFLLFAESNVPNNSSRGVQQMSSELRWATEILNGGQDEIGPFLPSL